MRHRFLRAETRQCSVYCRADIFESGGRKTRFGETYSRRSGAVGPRCAWRVCPGSIHRRCLPYDALSTKGIFERTNALPKAGCEEGEAIGEVISDVFGQAEEAFAEVLKRTKLADVLERAENL